MGAVHNLKPRRIFPIGVVYGLQGKPKGLDWLIPAVESLNNVLRNGVNIHGDHKEVSLDGGIIADLGK